jgi:hypothetical protein
MLRSLAAALSRHTRAHFSRRRAAAVVARRAPDPAVRRAAAAACHELERRLLLTVSIGNIDNPSINEGATLYLNAGVYVDYDGYLDGGDPDGSADVVVDFGDGTTASASVGSGANFLPFSHAYPDDGIFNASVTATGSVAGHNTSADFTVTVNDVLPDIRLGGSNYATRFQPYTLDLFHADPGQDPIDQWLVDWGDGHTSTVPGSATAATHRYDAIPEAVNGYGQHANLIRVRAIEEGTGISWPTGAILTGNLDGYYQTEVSVFDATPDAPYDLLVAPLSRTQIQLAWRMPAGSDPDGFTVESSPDGVTFTPVALLAPGPGPTARSYIVDGLDPLTNYSFRVSAYYSDTNSTYTDMAITTTTNDRWDDVPGGPVTPDLGGAVAWFGNGDDLAAGRYRILYAGGAVDFTGDGRSPPWAAVGYATATAGATEAPAWFGGQPYPGNRDGYFYRDSLERAQHDATPTVWPVLHDGGPLGVGLYPEPNRPTPSGPGVTWKLQRYVPHVYLQLAQDADRAVEGGQAALIHVSAEDHFGEDLVVKMDLAGDAVAPGNVARQFSARLILDDGHGGYTYAPVDLDDPIHPQHAQTTLPGGLNDGVVELTAVDDATPEWTMALDVRLADRDAYVPLHFNDHDNVDSDGCGDDEDPDVRLVVKDNDLWFDLETGTLVANYDDDNGNGKTDYEETAPLGITADDNLYQLTLHVPRQAKPGASITLSSIFNVYDTQFKANLLGDNGTVTWNDPTAVPESVWIEVKSGSVQVDDIATTLSATDHVPFVQHNTSVNFQIISMNDPNNDGGGDVKNIPREWLIGQMVDQYVSIQCPPEWRQNPTYQWSVDGNALRDYVTAPAGWARTYPLVDDDGGQDHPLQVPATGLKKSEIKFFWVSTDTVTDEQDVNVQVGNIHGETYQVSSRYHVTRPTSTATGWMGTSGVSNNKTRVGLVFSPAAGAKGGMNYFGSVSTPAGFATGEWTFLQTAQPIRTHTDDIGPHHLHNNGLWGLDENLAYPAGAGYPFNSANGWLADGTTKWADDTPENTFGGLDIKSTVDDKFYTFMMFRPPGADSRQVPLRVLGWQVKVAAEKINNVWQTIGVGTQSMTPSSGSFVTQTGEPIWDIVQSGSRDWDPG